MNPIKLTTLALPLLCLAAAPAQAQSSVTLSGLIDLGVYRGFDKVNQVGTIQRSHIAFSGVEDLGGGVVSQVVSPRPCHVVL